jgi:DNA/RNA endonuclease YhcR with UshA esterase domain
LRRFLALVTAALCVVIVSTGVGTAAPATQAVASAWCSGAQSWQSARRSIGRSVRVRAAVVSAAYASSSNGRPTFLNLGRAYPSPGRLTIVIWGRHRSNFPRAPEQMFRSGTTVCVQGFVETYQGVPEIEVTRWDAANRMLR